MFRALARDTAFLFAAVTSVLLAQETPLTAQIPTADAAAVEGNPLYRVEVVARTTPAVNYGHRTLPTRIGFAGAVYQPEAEGEAVIEAKRGVVHIDAKWKNLASPQRYGANYLAYVLWAVTPEGRAQNLGEITPDANEKAKLETSTQLQTFALIVTAEPYYSVTQPSNVVVLENKVRPDTVGRVQIVDAKYELLPRGRHRLDLDAVRAHDEERSGKKVSRKEYESLVGLYQARNAVQFAEHAGAAEHAATTLTKAKNLLDRAERHYASDPKSATVVTLAREATQTAEDARLITLRRRNPASPAGHSAVL